MAEQSHLRTHLQEIYAAALASVDGRACVRNALRRHEFSSPLNVIAIGKAASSMLQGALDALSDKVHQGLLITKYGHAESAAFPTNINLIEAGHPWPDQASLIAGKALLDFINTVPDDAQLLFLISGGASSLVEVLPDEITPDELHKLNDWLLSSGLDIHAMNHVRKSISCIKGGRLAQRLGGRPASVLLISDVPGDDPVTIGSGLLVADHLQQTGIPLDLPVWVDDLMLKGSTAPLSTDLCFDSVSVEIIASLSDAKHAAATKGRALGYEVYEHDAILGGDAVTLGRQLASELLSGPKGLHVWGGESTVRLPEHPGRGGRNQHLALAAAIELSGEDDVAFLAAGTDGSDGPTSDAGAIVDGQTTVRGQVQACSAASALSNGDSGSFLAASGDLIQTGPTGTNVMDLMLGIKT